MMALFHIYQDNNSNQKAFVNLRFPCGDVLKFRKKTLRAISLPPSSVSLKRMRSCLSRSIPSHRVLDKLVELFRIILYGFCIGMRLFHAELTFF